MEQSEFKSGQRFIAVASPAAMLLTWGLLWLAWRSGDWPQAALPEGRLRMLACSWAMLALLLLVQIGIIANLRFFCADGIDPLAPVQDRRLVVWGRILQNSMEQALVFALLAGAAALIGERAARMLPGASAAFLLGRLLFGAGYLAGWRYRAPGMGMTVAANVALFVTLVLAF